MNILEISQLQKRFGEHQVLTGLELSVPEHSIFGFVGQNGAGKTTTMKMVLGLLKPDAGSIAICGEPVVYGNTTTNRRVGYLPDVPEFYGYMRPMEYLSLCGRITRMAPRQIAERGEELLTLVGLEGEKRRIGGFSRGMKQRLGIAQALLNRPRLVICDEPTSALDPIGRKEVLDILLGLKAHTTVVFSTHVLSDVERICDHVAVLHQGKLALAGGIAEIKQQHRHDGFVIEFKSEAEAEQLAADQSVRQGAKLVASEGARLTLTVPGLSTDGQLIIQALAAQRLTPVRFEKLEPTLEVLFEEVVA